MMEFSSFPLVFWRWGGLEGRKEHFSSTDSLHLQVAPYLDISQLLPGSFPLPVVLVFKP